MYAGINEMNKFLSITQKIIITFIDASKNNQTFIGTGFWIKTNKEKLAFVTNKHNLIPKIKSSKYESWELKKLELRLRLHDNESKQPYNYTTIDCTEWKSIYNEPLDSPDILILLAPIPFKVNSIFSGKPELGYIPQEFLADVKYFENILQFTDHAYFIGFSDLNWNSSKYEYPISRNCNISSYPLIDFTEETKHNDIYDIKTKETCLVNGLSFGGSSGSPVLTYERGIKVGTGLTGGNYVEPKLIGIMSGHWDDKLSEDSFLKQKTHKGLSYFTKSTTILNLLNSLPD